MIKIVNYFRNRQYIIFLDCSFYEKDFDHKLKFIHLRKIENMKLVNIYLNSAD